MNLTDYVNTYLTISLSLDGSYAKLPGASKIILEEKSFI